MNRELYRQGDVLIERIDSAPQGKRTVRASGILAEGEKTGHAHRIAAVADAELYECGEGLYISVSERGVSIVHDEHPTIELPPGNYRVIGQYEYHPEAIRNVTD